MTRPRATTPDAILDAAAELFSRKPFHEVKLDEVAASARIGKGTIYLYWESKEQIYLAIIRRGFAAVLARIDSDLAPTGTPVDKLRSIVAALVDFAFTYPEVYRIMRSGTLTPEDPDLQAVRAQLVTRIVTLLKEGNSAGAFHDPHPALTAQFILSFVRGALLYPPPALTRASLTRHIMHVLTNGIMHQEDA